MQHRPITGAKRSQRRRWGEHRIGARHFHRSLVASHGPPERAALRQCIGLAGGCDQGAVGNSSIPPGNPCSRLPPRSSRSVCRTASISIARGSLAALPCAQASRKASAALTTAEKTRSVSRCERDRLVEEEQLGPTTATHHRTPPALVFAETDEPGLARPAPVQQGSGRRVMNDPAVAGEHSSLRYRDDIAEGRHPVLQRH
jgi:hypothetical protein